MMKPIGSISALVLFLTALLGSQTALAAKLYITPPSGDISVNGTMTADVRLDNEGDCVNAAEVQIRYPQNLIEVADVSRGNSIFTLWINEPSIHKDFGTVSFIGGIPGGYCGRVPGDPGTTNIVATLILKTAPGITTPQKADIGFLPDTKIYLNDGLGSEAKTSIKSSIYSVASGKESLDKWAEILSSDKTPPEQFAISLYQDSSIFNNNRFIVFSTIDKQSGLDHYEILESTSKNKDPLSAEEAKWREVSSPYQLKDQKMKSSVKIKAIDKAGNERITTLATPTTKEAAGPLYWFLALAIVSVLLTIARILI